MNDIHTTAPADAFTLVREAMRLRREADYQRGRVTANPAASDEAVARSVELGERADAAVRDAWAALYDAFASDPSRPSRKIAAQVAVEAVANDPSGFDDVTRRAVLDNGVAADVAPFYLDMIR